MVEGSRLLPKGTEAPVLLLLSCLRPQGEKQNKFMHEHKAVLSQMLSLQGFLTVSTDKKTRSYFLFPSLGKLRREGGKWNETNPTKTVPRTFV